MIGVIAYWNNHSWIYKGGAQKTLMSFWKLTLKAFGGTYLIFIDDDNSDPTCGDEQITYELYNNLDEALSKHSDKNFVFVEQKSRIPENLNTFSLKDFKHPLEDVFYIIGPDYGNGIDFGNEKIKPFLAESYFVYINQPNFIFRNFTYKIPLWSHIAMGIVLRDRFIKG